MGAAALLPPVALQAARPGGLGARPRGPRLAHRVPAAPPLGARRLHRQLGRRLRDELALLHVQHPPHAHGRRWGARCAQDQETEGCGLPFSRQGKGKGGPDRHWRRNWWRGRRRGCFARRRVRTTTAGSATKGRERRGGNSLQYSVAAADGCRRLPRRLERGRYLIDRGERGREDFRRLVNNVSRRSAATLPITTPSYAPPLEKIADARGPRRSRARSCILKSPRF